MYICLCTYETRARPEHTPALLYLLCHYFNEHACSRCAGPGSSTLVLCKTLAPGSPRDYLYVKQLDVNARKWARARKRSDKGANEIIIKCASRERAILCAAGALNLGGKRAGSLAQQWLQKAVEAVCRTKMYANIVQSNAEHDCVVHHMRVASRSSEYFNMFNDARNMRMPDMSPRQQQQQPMAWLLVVKEVRPCFRACQARAYMSVHKAFRRGCQQPCAFDTDLKCFWHPQSVLKAAVF